MMTTYVSRWEGKDGPPPGEGSGRPHEGGVIVSHDGARPSLYSRTQRRDMTKNVDIWMDVRGSTQKYLWVFYAFKVRQQICKD